MFRREAPELLEVVRVRRYASHVSRDRLKNQTRDFIPTLREAPSDAESPSHKLMVRAGMVRQLSAGSYSYLPLGARALPLSLPSSDVRTSDVRTAEGPGPGAAPVAGDR